MDIQMLDNNSLLSSSFTPQCPPAPRMTSSRDLVENRPYRSTLMWKALEQACGLVGSSVDYFIKMKKKAAKKAAKEAARRRESYMSIDSP